jgi:hypothetical protein
LVNVCSCFLENIFKLLIIKCLFLLFPVGALLLPVADVDRLSVDKSILSDDEDILI